MAAARKTYDDAFKAKTLARLANEPVASVAKDIKVTSATIYSWAQKAGLRLNGGKKKTAKKVAKKTAPHSNGSAPVAQSMNRALAQVERELSNALSSVRASREAMKAVFGV